MSTVNTVKIAEGHGCPDGQGIDGSTLRQFKYCQGIQSSSPVDSCALPVPGDMPGYDDQVIMAAGAFTQGSSIELSCDGPIREPYIAYQQGSLMYPYGKLAVMKAVTMLEDK